MSDEPQRIRLPHGPTGSSKHIELPDGAGARNPALGYLLALQGKAFSGMTYAGTVDPVVVAKRRAKGKLQKASRRRNRRR